MHVLFKIHYRNNLISKKNSYLIPRPPSWDDRNYSYGHQLYPSDNTVRVQEERSTVCGNHCIFYLIHRCAGHSMTNVTWLLENTMEATGIVQRFVLFQENRKMTSLPVPSFSVTWLPFMSHPLAMLLPVMGNCTFRTTAMVRKKARECAEHTSGYDVTSRHVTSCDVISG